MDLLATMLFGTVVIDSIKVRGISEGSVLTRTCIMAGIIAAVLLAAIYFSLTYTGATSVAVFGVSDNGAIALSSTLPALQQALALRYRQVPIWNRC